MAQNLYCSSHKVSSDKFREGYDNIKWTEKKETKKNGVSK
jgi:hypothetical protein